MMRSICTPGFSRRCSITGSRPGNPGKTWQISSTDSTLAISIMTVANVKREWNNIDILVCDRSSLQAVIIENKIRAADQPRQLTRYAGQMQEYACHVLYLTPDGREASEDSADDIEYRCISYKNDLGSMVEGLPETRL